MNLWVTVIAIAISLIMVLVIVIVNVIVIVIMIWIVIVNGNRNSNSNGINDCDSNWYNLIPGSAWRAKWSQGGQEGAEGDQSHQSRPWRPMGWPRERPGPARWPVRAKWLQIAIRVRKKFKFYKRDLKLIILRNSGDKPGEPDGFSEN